MEDFLSLSALIPLMVSVFAVVVSSLKVKSRIMAEKHFISAVRSQIDDGFIEVPAKTTAASMSKKSSEGFSASSDSQLPSGCGFLDDHGALTVILKSGDEHSVYRIPPRPLSTKKSCAENIR